MTVPAYPWPTRDVVSCGSCPARDPNAPRCEASDTDFRGGYPPLDPPDWCPLRNADQYIPLRLRRAFS